MLEGYRAYATFERAELVELIAISRGWAGCTRLHIQNGRSSSSEVEIAISMAT